MLCILFGLFCSDFKAESLQFSPLHGERWLILKEGEGYRALEIDWNGAQLGEIQVLIEEDLLECCVPDLDFYAENLAGPLKNLAVCLLQGHEPPSELQPLLNALLSLTRSSSPDTLNPSPQAAQLIGKMLKQFLSASPERRFVATLTEAAIGHRKNQNHDQAIFYYLKAMDFGGENPGILFNLARVYHEIGADERAISTLKQALVLNPEMKMARQFLKFLTS
ncbi:MAG: tetratricopeptide repeat protein [Desulfovibrionaceae bacterium]|nr:tetratricopeptide repeat protein [Desulfovibrionaceae bacterium]